MDYQTKSAAESRPTPSPMAESSPLPTTTNDKTNKNVSISFIGRAKTYVTENWKLITAVAGSIAAIVMFMGGCTEIPNNVMDWVANYRELTKSESVDANEVATRAWIVMENIGPEAPFDDNKDTIIRVRIKNSGRIPATVTGFVQLHYTTQFPLNEEAMFYGEAPKNISKSVLASGDVLDLKIPTNNSMLALRGSGLTVYMYVMGAINYEDAFGKHSTKFCVYRKDGDAPDAPLVSAPNNNWTK